MRRRRIGAQQVAGALFRAALVASCLRGALPPVDLRAVCLVRAIFDRLEEEREGGRRRRERRGGGGGLEEEWRREMMKDK